MLKAIGQHAGPEVVQILGHPASNLGIAKEKKKTRPLHTSIDEIELL